MTSPVAAVPAPSPSPASKPSKIDAVLAKVKSEVAVVIGALLAAVNALQLLAVPLPSGVHAAIVVVTTVAAALGIRTQVSPA